MVNNVSCLDYFSRLIVAREVQKIANSLGIHRHIDFVGICKGNDLQIIPICTSFLHCFQMLLERSVDFFGGNIPVVNRPLHSTPVLSLWISTSTTARVNRDKRCEAGRIGTHVLHSISTVLSVLGFVSVQLVRKGVEETISYIWVSIYAIR